MKNPYRVNSWDVCVPGNERMRNQTELLIAIPVSGADTVETIRRALKADIQSYMQPDSFSFDQCNAAIDAFCDNHVLPLIGEIGVAEANAAIDSLYDGEFPNDDAQAVDDDEGLTLYVYMQTDHDRPVI